MLMDLETYESEDESTYSFTTSVNIQNGSTAEDTLQPSLKDGDISDYLDPDHTLACQTKKADPFGVRSRPATSKKLYAEQISKQENSREKIYHVNYDTILKLKESTKKLLCVLEEIQAKTHSKHLISNDTQNFSRLFQPIPQSKELKSVTDLISDNALKKLEVQANTLTSIYVKEEEDDDCSVYKRLTRKCNCLNQYEYNDFIIHFNENTKYRTSNVGEIIKNMRILKKFLYMNGVYTKNALLFLNEGLSESAHSEKIEIIQGCTHADMCNVFDDHSIVVMYIAWPCKNDYIGDTATQSLTAGFLYKLSQLEEGRRYLNYSTRISNDIKKVIRKRSSVLEFETVETLTATLNLLNPPLPQNVNVTYYCKPVHEGMGKKTVQTLAEHRQNMTLEEILTHLDLLNQISNRDKGKVELITCLPAMMLLFKRLLVEFDNSQMNIVVTNILNNIVSKSPVKDKESELPKTLVIADVSTEPIHMKHETIQIPIKKSTRKGNKSKITLGNAPNKFRNSSRRKVAERHNARAESCTHWEPTGNITKSRKFSRDMRSSVIVVPIEKETS